MSPYAIMAIVAAVVLLAIIGIDVRYRHMWFHEASQSSVFYATTSVQLHASSDLYGGQLRNGDIVAFAASTADFSQKTVACLLGSPFFHMGVVVQSPPATGTLNGRTGILHYVDPNDRNTDFFLPLRYLCTDRNNGGNGDGPCISDLQEVIASYVRKYGPLLVQVLRFHEQPHSYDTLIKTSMAIGCGRPYDAHYYLSYLANRCREGVPERLHCNTFVGILYERLGHLPVSTRPVDDYRPGRIYKLLTAHHADSSTIVIPR